MHISVSNRKSYIFLSISLLVTLTMLLLDPIAMLTSETITPVLIAIILIGDLIAIFMAFITFRSAPDKKILPIIAAILTILNSTTILFFLWFGFNFA
jgi:hypothetical protein